MQQTVITRYHPATTERGARWSATSSGGHRIRIKEHPEWTHSAETGHFAALRALQNKIGDRWPGSPMIGGTLNQRGDVVWVFEKDSVYSDYPPEPIGERYRDAAAARANAHPGDYIMRSVGGRPVYVVATRRESMRFNKLEWRTFRRVSV